MAGIESTDGTRDGFDVLGNPPSSFDAGVLDRISSSDPAEHIETVNPPNPTSFSHFATFDYLPDTDEYRSKTSPDPPLQSAISGSTNIGSRESIGSHTGAIANEEFFQDWQTVADSTETMDTVQNGNNNNNNSNPSNDEFVPSPSPPLPLSEPPPDENLLTKTISESHFQFTLNVEETKSVLEASLSDEVVTVVEVKLSSDIITETEISIMPEIGLHGSEPPDTLSNASSGIAKFSEDPPAVPETIFFGTSQNVHLVNNSLLEDNASKRTTLPAVQNVLHSEITKLKDDSLPSFPKFQKFSFHALHHTDEPVESASATSASVASEIPTQPEQILERRMSAHSIELPDSASPPPEVESYFVESMEQHTLHEDEKNESVSEMEIPLDSPLPSLTQYNEIQETWINNDPPITIDIERISIDENLLPEPDAKDGRTNSSSSDAPSSFQVELEIGNSKTLDVHEAMIFDDHIAHELKTVDRDHRNSYCESESFQNAEDLPLFIIPKTADNDGHVDLFPDFVSPTDNSETSKERAETGSSIDTLMQGFQLPSLPQFTATDEIEVDAQVKFRGKAPAAESAVMNINDSNVKSPLVRISAIELPPSGIGSEKQGPVLQSKSSTFPRATTSITEQRKQNEIIGITEEFELQNLPKAPVAPLDTIIMSSVAWDQTIRFDGHARSEFYISEHTGTSPSISTIDTESDGEGYELSHERKKRRNITEARISVHRQSKMEEKSEMEIPVYESIGGEQFELGHRLVLPPAPHRPLPSLPASAPPLTDSVLGPLMIPSVESSIPVMHAPPPPLRSVQSFSPQSQPEEPMRNVFPSAPVFNHTYMHAQGNVSPYPAIPPQTGQIAPNSSCPVPKPDSVVSVAPSQTSLPTSAATGTMASNRSLMEQKRPGRHRPSCKMQLCQILVFCVGCLSVAAAVVVTVGLKWEDILMQIYYYLLTLIFIILGLN